MTPLIFAAVAAVFISSLIYLGMDLVAGPNSQESRRIKSRVESLFSAKSASIEKKATFSNIFRINQALKRQPLSKKLYTLLAFSGWNISLSIFLLGDMLWAFFVFFLSMAIFESILMAIPVTLIAAVLPYWVLVINRNRYIVKFTTAFPDALMLIKSALQAGQGVQSAFKMVAKEGPYPVSKEFAQVVHEMELGSHVTEALSELYKRIATIDLRIFVLGIFIQTEVGGNLVELMSHIERTIRDRLTMMREIRTLSAQGKMTGLVLMLLPVIMAGILYAMNPGYFTPMMEDEGGRKILAGAVVLQFIGGYLVKRITTFRVS